MSGEGKKKKKVEGGAASEFIQRNHYGDLCKSIEEDILAILEHVWLKVNGISRPGQHTKYRLGTPARYLDVYLIRLVLLSFIRQVSQLMT